MRKNGTRTGKKYQFLDRTGMPQFYKLMLQLFIELISSYQTDFGQNLVLFNNREIPIDGKTFFYKTCSRMAFSESLTSLQRIKHFSHMMNLFKSMA